MRRARGAARQGRGGWHGQPATTLMQVKHARAIICDAVIAARRDKPARSFRSWKDGSCGIARRSKRKPPGRLISGIEMPTCARYWAWPRRLVPVERT